MNNSSNQVLSRFLDVIIEQVDAPLDEVKMWLLSNPVQCNIEETHTMIHLLERVQRQVRAQVQLLAQIVKTQTIPAGLNHSMPVSVQTPYYTEPVELPPEIPTTVPIETIMLTDEEFNLLMEHLAHGTPFKLDASMTRSQESLENDDELPF